MRWGGVNSHDMIDCWLGEAWDGGYVFRVWWLRVRSASFCCVDDVYESAYSGAKVFFSEVVSLNDYDCLVSNCKSSVTLSAMGVALSESGCLESYACSRCGEGIAWVVTLEVFADEDCYSVVGTVDAGSVGCGSLAEVTFGKVGSV